MTQPVRGTAWGGAMRLLVEGKHGLTSEGSRRWTFLRIPSIIPGIFYGRC